MAPPYMVQLCQRLFNIDYAEEEENILAGACSNWLYQALDHCTAVLTKKPGCQKLWNKLLNLKQFIFPENATSLLSNKIPISVHPDLLSPTNCQELANQIIKDYIHYIPRYMSILNENHCLWLILRGILGVVVIGLCVLVVARRYNAIHASVPKNLKNSTTIRERLLRRNIKTMLYETKYLSVVPMIDPTLLRCGCPALGLKIDAKKLCNIKAILVKSTSRDNPADADNHQTQSIAKLQKFFQNSGKYRIVINLDLDWDEEDGAGGRQNNATATRNSAIPIHKPTRRIGIRRKL